MTNYKRPIGLFSGWSLLLIYPVVYGVQGGRIPHIVGSFKHTIHLQSDRLVRGMLRCLIKVMLKWQSSLLSSQQDRLTNREQPTQWHPFQRLGQQLNLTWSQFYPEQALGHRRQ